MNLVAIDRDSTKRTIIAPVLEAGPFSNLDVSGNKVVWTDRYNEYGYYKVYNFDTKKVDAYKTNDFYAGNVRMDGKTIIGLLWTDMKTWDSGSFGYLNTQSRAFTTIQASNATEADVYNNKIVYFDEVNRAVLYELKTKKEATIANYAGREIRDYRFTSDGTFVIASSKPNGKLKIDLITFK